jgi:hypothetical protein
MLRLNSCEMCSFGLHGVGLCDGLVEAIGRVTVTGAVGRSFTAHPKLDPVTGAWCGCCCYVPYIARLCCCSAGNSGLARGLA